MSMAKSKGSLGFRSLHGFNLALLGKHCWNLINNPNSLVARLLKARCYPQNHFLKASCGGGASFIWAGIWRAKEMLKKGYRWVVGDGKDIDVYEDQWLKAKSDYRVDLDHSNMHSSAKVYDFFKQNTKEWDVEKVRNSFNDDDAEAILLTRIPQNQRRDRLAWMHSNNGLYSVKTGYQFWQTQMNVGGTIPHSKGWNRIWKSSVPHKLKVFLWRICRNTLPVRNLLRSRGVQTTIICPMCDTDMEHLLHLFFDCKYAKDCWQQLGINFDMNQVDSAPVWLLGILSSESHEVILKVAAVLWGLWFARNKKVWDNQIMTPAVAMSWSYKQIEDWRVAQKKKRRVAEVTDGGNPGSNATWIAPATGSLKCNVDASVYAGASSFSIGIVIRDAQGSFVKGKCMNVEGTVSVLEAELFGVREALTWILQEVEEPEAIESDSLLAVNAVNGNAYYQVEMGDILDECRSMLRSRSCVLVSFVKRQANRMAYLIARVPYSLNCFSLFMSPQ